MSVLASTARRVRSRHAVALRLQSFGLQRFISLQEYDDKNDEGKEEMQSAFSNTLADGCCSGSRDHEHQPSESAGRSTTLRLHAVSAIDKWLQHQSQKISSAASNCVKPSS
ncbi:hypothetical protein MRX96_004667 [Rhipicephalus microplus]